MGDCVIKGENLGSKCKRQPGFVVGTLFNPDKKTITVADFAKEEDVRALFQTGNWHILTGEQNTITQPEPVVVTLDGNENLKLGENAARFMLKSVKVSDAIMRAKASWDEAQVNAILIYSNGFLQGKTFDDGITIEPSAASLFFNREYGVSGSANFSNMEIQLKNNQQKSLNKNQFTIDLNEVATDYDFNDFLDFELKDIKIEIVSSTPTNQVVTVKTLEGAGVSGLVAADFVLTSGVNTDAVDTLVDNGDGSYSLTETVALAAGTWVLSLKPKTTLSLKGYEPINTDTFTVSA